jgi:cytochrome bd-type quinol oxidase subunit 1
MHVYTAAIIEGLLLQILILAFAMSKASIGAERALKTLLTLVLLLLFVQPLIGHFQFEELKRDQPQNAAAIQGRQYDEPVIAGMTEINSSMPAKAVFNFFHLMILFWIGIVVLVFAVLFKWRKVVVVSKIIMYGLAAAFVFSILAPMAGWAASESGRQPWLIYGVIKTAKADSSPSLSMAGMVLSLVTNFIVPLGLCYCWIMIQKMEFDKFVDQVKSDAV